MQGRLLPKYNGLYQAHPVGYWSEEFFIAKEIGLECIEFILDYNGAEKNPILTKEGLIRIMSYAQDSGIHIQSICADYFMEAPFHRNNDIAINKSQKLLVNLLESAKFLGVKDIVIPCVDKSSIDDVKHADLFYKNLSPIVAIAEQYSINLSLETDLAPQPFLELLERFNSKRVTVNYDIGNSASLGYDPVDELNAYGSMISVIHIKDRVFQGGPIELGKGSAKFSLFFSELKKFNYRGNFIMQAYRDDQGIDIFKKQLEWVMPYIKLYLND